MPSAMQAALWARRFLLVVTGIFVASVFLGSLIGTEGFIFGIVIDFPLWVWSLGLSLVALWQASNSELGRRTRRMAVETIGALAVILAAGLVIALLTNMLSVRIGK